MNDKRGFERTAAEWLDDGSDTTPPAVIDAVLLAARSTPQERDLQLLWRIRSMAVYLRVAAVIVTAAVAGLAALYALGYGPNIGSEPIPDPTSQPTPSPAAVAPVLGPDAVSDERMAVVRRHVDAINAKDAVSFIAAFRPEGVFGPGGDFRQSSSLFGNSLPIADADLVEAWMAINRAWRFEAEIVNCNQDPEAPIAFGYGAGTGDPMVVKCEMRTRWHSLSLEITELWSYELHGTGVGHWEFAFLDLNPGERALPLGYDGIWAWEAWLEATDQEAAARYLNPREEPACDGCDPRQDELAPGDPERAAQLGPLLSTAQNDWSIQGHDFAPRGLIPYDPAFADEIEASINDYLQEIQP